MKTLLSIKIERGKIFAKFACCGYVEFQDLYNEEKQIVLDNIYKSLPEEPVSEDLKAASYDYVKSNHKDIASIDDCALLYDAIEFGAKWKEEQMMKDAVVTTVVESYGSEKVNGEWRNVVTPKIEIYDNSLVLGDKVKVVVIKWD